MPQHQQLGKSKYKQQHIPGKGKGPKKRKADMKKRRGLRKRKPGELQRVVEAQMKQRIERETAQRANFTGPPVRSVKVPPVPSKQPPVPPNQPPISGSKK